MSIFSTCKSLNEVNILESAVSTYDSIESLEEGVLRYTTSMIPVCARNTADGTKYLVEFDMLQKLQKPIVEAFEDVCEFNNIDADDTYVAVPNNESAIDDVYVSESSYLKSCIANDTNDINSLIESGVNVLSYEPLNEFGVSKELKNIINDNKKSYSKEDNMRLLKDGQFNNAECKKLIDKLFATAKSIADFKFVKRRAKSMALDMGIWEIDPSYYNNIADKCDNKIAELKEAKKSSKS